MPGQKTTPLSRCYLVCQMLPRMPCVILRMSDTESRCQLSINEFVHRRKPTGQTTEAIFTCLCPIWKQWRTKVTRWSPVPLQPRRITENVSVCFVTSISVRCALLVNLTYGSSLLPSYRVIGLPKASSVLTCVTFCRAVGLLRCWVCPSHLHFFSGPKLEIGVWCGWGNLPWNACPLLTEPPWDLQGLSVPKGVC